ncbi:MarR family winged helix-turn-helix transcriptional regulator [Shewanella sp. SNU WT4]|uniref:MarR family winged helix-turn-helix transcriptional regulator n=2 Tax=Shewanella TaxID=22 RepID=UPI001F0F493A|nr:MarR family winged helix-turn-helix transcriptional regulator [Shewanella sp. SNU WT4]
MYFLEVLQTICILSIVFYDSVIYNTSMTDNNYLKNLLGACATTIASNIEMEVAELDGRSLSHEAALVAINNHPNDGIEMLSKVLGLTHSGSVRLVNNLVHDGFVDRHRSKIDARAVVLCVTDAGRDRANKILLAREKITSSILDILGENEKETIVPILEKILSSMTDNVVEARRICRFCDEGVCRKAGCPVEIATIIKA